MLSHPRQDEEEEEEEEKGEGDWTMCRIVASYREKETLPPRLKRS